MSEMVERVKAALRLSIENSGHNFSDAGAEAVYRDAAVVAIAAMREPTEAMINRGILHIDFDERCEPQVERDEITTCWRAMSDAALAD